MLARLLVGLCGANLMVAAATPPDLAAATFPDPLIVDRLGHEHGFPSETVTALHRDGIGQLWVGSREGLAVWNGYDVRVFEHAVNDPGSLSDNAVRRIHEDRAGRLWIGTDAGGLQRLDLATWTFESFRHDAADPRSLSHDAVYSMAEDDAGALWIGTQDGLNRLDLASRRIERLVADPSDPATLPHGWVYDLRCDRRGRVWIATVGGGVAWVDPETRRVTRVPFGPASSGTERSRLVYSIAERSDGTLWFGAEDGIFSYDDASGHLLRVRIPAVPARADPPIVTCIAFDRAGRLWFTTWDDGLFAFDPASGESRSYRHERGREAGLATDRFSCLFVDDSDQVWLGSWGHGIHRFSAKAGPFSPILAGDPEAGGLPYPEVTSVLEDSRGGLWVGTWGRGLHHRGTQGSAFLPPQAASDVLAAMATPLALVEDGRGGVWAGTMAGLFHLDHRRVVDRAYRHAPDQAAGLGPGYVHALALDHGGRLWIATGGSGLYRLTEDAAGPSFTSFRSVPGDENSLSDDQLTTLRFDREGMLWIGTRTGGLNRLDPTSGRFARFLPDATDPRSLPHHTVTSILEDRQGRIWAGTAGGGLARLEKDAFGSWTVSRVGVTAGLANGSVVSLAEDDDGSLWIATRRGLSRFESASGRFYNFGPGDGLPSLEFRPNAAAAGARRLHFGSLNGLLEVARGTPFFPAPSAPSMVTAIRTEHGPWPTGEPAWQTRAIAIPYGALLSVEFGVLDLRPPHRFAYRLGGENEPWIDLGARREIVFAALQPGRYSLSVRGLNGRGVWTESAHALEIRVPTPLWMAWWFRALLLGGAAAVASVWVRARFVALERRSRELARLHHDRELALAQLRTSESELHDAYESLRRLTRRLEQAKEDERRHIARELHDEMGQALSAMKINLKALERIEHEPPARRRIDDAISLVDGIIGHVRALSLDLRPQLLEELGLLAAVRNYAESQSFRSGVAIQIESNSDADDLPSELAIAAFRIVQESIHNALRHAGASSIAVAMRHDPRRLSLSVTDDGRGFDVAEAMQRAASGRHLGLLGMRERVESLGGTLEVDSGAECGTTVHAVLPIDQEGLRP